MIICRELGTPCAASVTDASRKIPDGAAIRVNGMLGTVEVL
jgi:rifampicin phosphotransferase